MTAALTPEQLEIVEQNITEMFAFTQDEVAERLGLQRQPDGSWSEADAEAIIAEIDRKYRTAFISSVLG
jgi:hypothetical protein